MKKSVFTKSDKFKSEYSCAVVRIGTLEDVEGSDFLAKTLVEGTQIVIRKDEVKEGDILIYAANETQLNEKFLSVNNLFEIGCRDKNANVKEVNAVMEPYMKIKKEADDIKAKAKCVKNSIESYTKKAKKLKTEAKRIIGKENPDLAEIERLNKESDKYTAIAISKTTEYTQLKAEAEKLIKSGEHIVNEAKKGCGFFNKYGRVRCITLKGEPSFGFLFTPTSLMKFDSSIKLEDVESYVGNEFDTINGKLFVKAYVPPVKPEQGRREKTNRANKHLNRFDRLVEGEFRFHYDTQQLQKEISLIKPTDEVTLTVKEHGTSVCIGKLHVKEKKPIHWYQSLWNKVVDKASFLRKYRVIDYNIVYGPVFSSRTVIKNRYINEGVGEGFYGFDIWSEYGKMLYPYLDEGMTVYGEIVGYLPDGKAIQKFYDYGCEDNNSSIMIYRIVTTNDDGSKFEWNVSEVREWTERLIKRMKENNDENYKNVHPITILYHGTLMNLYPSISATEHWHENILEAMKNDKEFLGMEKNEPLCKKNIVPREGICLRIDHDVIPRCWKLKCSNFLMKEAIMVDSGNVDIEMTETNY